MKPEKKHNKSLLNTLSSQGIRKCVSEFELVDENYGRQDLKIYLVILKNLSGKHISPQKKINVVFWITFLNQTNLLLKR